MLFDSFASLVILATVFFSHAEKELIEFIGNGSVIFSKSPLRGGLLRYAHSDLFPEAVGVVSVVLNLSIFGYLFHLSLDLIRLRISLATKGFSRSRILTGVKGVSVKRGSDICGWRMQMEK